MLDANGITVFDLSGITVSDDRATTIAELGRGNLDLVGFMSVCDDIGLEGVVSIEVMSAELRQLDVDDYARLVASTTLEVLGRVDAAARHAQNAARPAVIPPSTKIV